MRIQEFDEAWQIESFDLFEKGGTTIDDIDGEEEIAADAVAAHALLDAGIMPSFALHSMFAILGF